jgi:hypothetical protein
MFRPLAADFYIGAETPDLGIIMRNRRTTEYEDEHENEYDKGT